MGENDEVVDIAVGLELDGRVLGLVAYVGANFFPSIMDMAFTAYAMVQVS